MLSTSNQIETAIGWFMHAGWDFMHHLWGGPIWPFMPTSSFGCLIFDALIACWFLIGAVDRCAPIDENACQRGGMIEKCFTRARRRPMFTRLLRVET